jgi:hypothetical protein
MSEKMPQSNSEKQPSIFLVARSNGEITPGNVTKRSRIESVLQRDGTYRDVTLREVEFPKIVGPDGKEAVPTRMVPEFALSDEYQASLAEQLHDGLYDPQPIEANAVEKNEYDDLFSDSYNESDHSVQGAAIEHETSEEKRREMQDYSAVTLEGALRNDTDLSSVLEVALKQAGQGIPKDRHELIEMMGQSEAIKDTLTRYFKVKAEYYHADLPDRVQANTTKKPNFPGGTPQPSIDVAIQYAVAMLSGEWDQSREDGEIEHDAQGNVIRGQHRAAARTILMSPKMIKKEQYE